MTERVDQCVTQCNGRKDGLIYTFKQPGVDAPCDWGISCEKLHWFRKQTKA